MSSPVLPFKKPNASVTPAADHLVRVLDEKIGKAIKEAKDAGLAQGLVVAIVHGHDVAETIEMMGCVP